MLKEVREQQQNDKVKPISIQVIQTFLEYFTKHINTNITQTDLNFIEENREV